MPFTHYQFLRRDFYDALQMIFACQNLEKVQPAMRRKVPRNFHPPIRDAWRLLLLP